MPAIVPEHAATPPTDRAFLRLPGTRLYAVIAAVLFLGGCGAIVYSFNRDTETTVLGLSNNWYYALVEQLINNYFEVWWTDKANGITTLFSVPTSARALTARDTRMIEHVLNDAGAVIGDTEGFYGLYLIDSAGRCVGPKALCSQVQPPLAEFPQLFVRVIGGEPAAVIQVPLLYDHLTAGHAGGVIPLRIFTARIARLLASPSERGRVMLLQDTPPGPGYRAIQVPALRLPPGFTLYIAQADPGIAAFLASRTEHQTAIVLAIGTVALLVLLTLLYRQGHRVTRVIRALPLLAQGDTAHLRTAIPLPRDGRFFRDETDDLSAELLRVSMLLDFTRAQEMQAQRDISGFLAQADLERERAALIADLLHAAEAEKSAIARDLHDETGQRLVALRMELASSADAGIPPDRVPRLVEHLNSLQFVVRNVINNLRPPLIEVYGLRRALFALCAEWKESKGAPAIELTVSAADVDNLPDLLQTAIYRIVQEIITNCVKHANASRLVIYLAKSDDSAIILLEAGDNGVGFDTKQRGGKNLESIRSRATSLGGQVSVLSTPGEGTHVWVKLPTQIGTLVPHTLPAQA